jgi:hypothetical protein
MKRAKVKYDGEVSPPKEILDAIKEMQDEVNASLEKISPAKEPTSEAGKVAGEKPSESPKPPEGEVVDEELSELPKVKTTSPLIHVEYPPTSLSYMGTGKLETEFGIEERQPTQRKRDIYTIKEADELLGNGWDAQKELNKIDSGEKTFVSDAEYINLTRYAAELADRLRTIKGSKTVEYDRTLRELSRVANASNLAGKVTGRALGIRGRFSTVAEGSYGEFMLTEMAANKDAPLTEKQKETANAEFDKLDAARKKLDDDTKTFEEKVAAFRAERELGKTKKAIAKGKKRTHEELVKEREDIIKNIKDKWGDAGKDILSIDIPYRKQISAIAPDVLRLARNLVEDGIIKLEEVVKNIHSKVGGDTDLTEKDIHNILAGEYNEKKITKRDAAIKMENLRIEAKLINKYESLLKGAEPKNEKAKIKRNQEIEDLRKKIKEFRKEESEANKFIGEEFDTDFKKLQAAQKRNESETNKIKELIAKGDFALPAKKIPLMEDREIQKRFPEQFKETRKSLDEYIKAKRAISLRRLKQMYENKTSEEKIVEIFSKALNVPRTIMASFDFSAPLRQAIIASAAHPQIASRALKFMFKAAKDEKVYNRWLEDVHNHPRWYIAEKTGLGITDPLSLHVKTAEEAFQGAPYAEKIPLVGLGVKASERAYIGFLNKLRWDLFNMYADRFEDTGNTYENNQKLYDGVSSLINSETGRGGMKGLENAAPIFNWFLFASKLIASRINMLGLSDIPNLAIRGATLGKYGIDYGFYTRLPKELRVEAAKDMSKFLAVGMSTLLIAKLLGADTEDDPRSSDFGKIRVGNSRWDIWGGFQPYARVLTQVLTGQRKTTTTGEIQELDEGFMGQNRFSPLVRFGRGKLAPVPATVLDLAIRRDAAGQSVTVGGELLSLVTPLMIRDVYEGMKDQGVKALFTVGIPAAFGVGVQTFKPSQSKQKTFNIYTQDEKGNPVIKQATPEQYKKYKQRKEELGKEILQENKEDGIGFNEYGAITFDTDKIEMVKEYKDLSEDEIDELNKKVSLSAGDQAREEFQPEQYSDKIKEVSKKANRKSIQVIKNIYRSRPEIKSIK